jgi:hypothetical protein
MKLGPRDRQIPFRHALNNVRFTSILLKRMARPVCKGFVEIGG